MRPVYYMELFSVRPPGDPCGDPPANLLDPKKAAALAIWYEICEEAAAAAGPCDNVPPSLYDGCMREAGRITPQKVATDHYWNWVEPFTDDDDDGAGNGNGNGNGGNGFELPAWAKVAAAAAVIFVGSRFV